MPKSPLDIPAEIVALADTAPYWINPRSTPSLLAHFWPAIERHIREQVARQLYDQNPDRDADFTAGVDWAIDTIRNGQ